MRAISDLQRKPHPFEVISDYVPSGDQPTAIAEIARRIQAGENDVVLLGATGTGKSATTAWLIEKLQRPTLVLAPNKTLAAQLANEFRELLPNNAVEYFVSYYDYYQPEAYVPQSDTFIEKDSSVNAEVERLRHSATNSLLTRRDVIVVATVSCIYGLGTPQEYVDRMIRLRVGDSIDRNTLLRQFVDIQYKRNDIAFERGTFRVRGDTVEIIPMYEELAIRVEMFGDEIEKIMTLHPLTGEIVREESEMYVFPASHYAAGPETMKRAVTAIEEEMEKAVDAFERQNKLLEAQRIRMRTTFDIEMIRQLGFCSGIENYSRHIDGREREALLTVSLITFQKTSSSSSMNHTSLSHKLARCMKAMPPESEPSLNTASDFRVRWITGHSDSMNFSLARARRSISPQHLASMNSRRSRAMWSSK
jgi:excinuclease ABC subunit B